MADFNSHSLVSKEYRKTVDEAAEQMNGVVFLNDDIHHARYLFGKIFEKAKEGQFPIRLISGHLRKDFYDDLVNCAESALERGCSVDAYVAFVGEKSDLIEGGNRFAKLLDEHPRANLHCRQSQEAEFEAIPHMILAGEKGEIFRYETDTKAHKALFAFGMTESPEKDMGGILMGYFKRLVEQYWGPALV